ncbi:MAG: hypothetical protein HYS44_01490 [Candidatus Niyogibacteria bacterium]|nr:hypothetical protein [Candidatus Niyogibacteria bacterium]
MDTIKAVVQKVIREGKHGPFAVATSNRLEGSVTFSLESTVWKEKERPEEGTMVFLGELRQKRAGWRAKHGRFWKPSDEQTQQIERSRTMEFLYPISRQFPFDWVCDRIVRELETRNWQVPGIAVEFHEYGSGEQKFRAVSQIKSRDFKLRFGRMQGTLPGGRWNDANAVTEIIIPRMEIRVYSDESGPTFYFYVGTDWEQDREQFMSGSRAKVNSRLDGEPRMYLQYTGGCDCHSGSQNHTHRGRRSPLLVHTNDLGREYDPEGNEPKFFRTDRVMVEFEQYLERVALYTIVSYPIPQESVDMFAVPAPVPFPESVGPLFCFGEHRDAGRIRQGKANADRLEPADRYGLSCGGYRLLSLGTSNDGTVPEIAYEGFLWCGIGGVTAEMAIDSLEIPGHNRWSDRERFVIRVKPSRANGIYIADHAQYEKRRKELADSLKDRDRFTDAEVADFTRARARTIVPLSEYKGGFEQPVVLIGRELSFDEVEVVSGPHKDRSGH